MPNTNANQRLYRRKAASDFIKSNFSYPCEPTTLNKLAALGGGPSYIKAGRFPLYPESELIAWVQAKMSGLKRSTSDIGKAA